MKLNHVLFAIVAAAIVVGAIALSSQSTPSTATKTQATSGPDIQLKVRDQVPGENGPSTGTSNALQPAITSGGAVDTSPACQRQQTNLQQVQGGACTDQDQAKQLIRQ